ncbi:MAG: hypothetical protein II376_00355 [Clostridia bacterium]|nr:hypothetical protein [Clostridia bacterium]
MKGLKTAAVFILICIVLSACGKGENPDKAAVTDALDRIDLSKHEVMVEWDMLMCEGHTNIERSILSEEAAVLLNDFIEKLSYSRENDSTFDAEDYLNRNGENYFHIYVYMSDNEYIWFRGQGSGKCLVLHYDETGERKAALFDEEHKSLENFYEFCEE